VQFTIITNETLGHGFAKPFLTTFGAKVRGEDEPFQEGQTTTNGLFFTARIQRVPEKIRLIKPVQVFC
jgi:hypothetical protein